MIEIVPFNALGRFDNDWLAARYHFSFAGYFDPERMGLGPLRVWNDDTIAPGGGFDQHGHRDMEIITYVRSGAISHQDHLGHRGRTEAGDVQVMSAGKGILHAEHNLEPVPTSLFQIWIEPAEQGLQPRWDQRRFPKPDRDGALVALASGRSHHPDALPIHQDAALLGASLAPGQSLEHALDRARRAYLVPAFGKIEINGLTAEAGDGVSLAELDRITVTALADSEIVLADLPS